MAKNIFITQWFSDDMVTAGETLLRKLDEQAAQVAAAFWLLDAEENKWELVIVSPLVTTNGPRNYYNIINKANEATDPDELIIPLHDIRVANTSNRVLNAIKNSPLKGAILGHNRLGKNIIGDIYIEDMYLYRIDWALLEQKTDLVT